MSPTTTHTAVSDAAGQERSTNRVSTRDTPAGCLLPTTAALGSCPLPAPAACVWRLLLTSTVEPGVKSASWACSPPTALSTTTCT